jgi:DNA-binding CsgD family transcriptional regulator
VTTSAEELAHAAVADSPADAFGRLTVWTCLAVLAAVSADGGAMRSRPGSPGLPARSPTPPKATAELIDSVAGACRAALGHDRFAEAWAAGQGMALEDAAAYASRGRGRRRRPATGWAALTPTELRVARAVADGLSNPQIAERMFISRRTVATHLTSIFRKLGVSSRAELAAVAVRRDG